MKLNTVIFDMDGLLINSEPFWEKAGTEVLAGYGATLTPDLYKHTTGLRTTEWLQWWFQWFKIDKNHIPTATQKLNNIALKSIINEAEPMPGAVEIVNFFKSKGFTIGLASSSPTALIEAVIQKLNIGAAITAYTSAENLQHGKPHPEVYLNCASILNVSALECVCIEDSVNGMIAAKAARMKCVVVPAPENYADKRYGLADLMLPSLKEFNDTHLETLKG